MLGRPGNNLKSGIVCELGPPPPVLVFSGPAFFFFFFFPLYKWVFLSFFTFFFSELFSFHNALN